MIVVWWYFNMSSVVLFWVLPRMECSSVVSVCSVEFYSGLQFRSNLMPSKNGNQTSKFATIVPLTSLAKL